MITPVSRRAARRLVAAAATTLATLTPFSADAGLIMDLRAIGGSATILNGGKNFISAGPGSTITIGVFARVSGTNGIHDETVQDIFGSFASTGSLLLNMGNLQPVNAFDASSYQLGSVQDFDSDGDLDIGSAGSTITGKWFARSGAPTSAGTPVDLNTGEVQVAVFNMTVMSSTGAASVNFIPRTNSTGGNLSVSAVWFQDNDGHSYTPTSGSYGPGAPVTSFVPEPAALGLLSLGSIALCARRRPGKCSLATP